VISSFEATNNDIKDDFEWNNLKIIYDLYINILNINISNNLDG